MNANAIDRVTAHAGLKALADAHYGLLEAHLVAGKMQPDDARYKLATRDLDALALLLAEGKWQLSIATGDCADFAMPTASAADLAVAMSALSECAQQSRTLAAWLLGDCARPSLATHFMRVTHDHEILRIGRAPIVPAICPIVLLQGSWLEMGAQYVQQCIEIFGEFVFERAGRRQFSDDQQRVVAMWTKALVRHAPAVHEFAIGMARGSQASGWPLSSDQAIALWTGWQAPCDRPQELGVSDSMTASIMSYFGALRGDSPTAASHDLCSGFAAWGHASRDGALIAGATTDHDATFQVTIVAYPNGGKPFAYTPFSANGSIPGVGYFQFAGLPGVNRDGLCYVHHGGAIGACAEPVADWGFGLRRGASTLELLANCATAREAEDRELAWPIGDAAAILGAPGGFYADPNNGYVLESRRNAAQSGAPIIRRTTPGTDGAAHDFLYANNNCLDPRSAQLFFPPIAGYRFETATGWFTLDEADCRHAQPAIAGRRMWTKSSESRNRYLYRELLARSGQLTLQGAREIYSRGPRFEFSAWSDFERRWTAGERFEGSTAHRGNAFTALVRAHPGQDPEYWGCMGNAAGRGVTPNRAGHGYFYFDETYTFWRIILKDKPRAVVQAAEADASCLLEAARRVCVNPSAESQFGQWLHAAELHLARGRTQPESTADTITQHDQLSELARRLREFTRAQVRARQVLRALAPSAEMSGHLD